MWKQGPSQPVITHRFSRNGIPCDGTPVSFDLVAGTKESQVRDLVVTLSRNPVNLTRGDEKFDWTATFELPDGGLVESQDEFMFKAPESGYQRSFRVEMLKDLPTWKRLLKKRFYVTLRGGKLFGSLDVNLSAFYQTSPTGLTMDVVINPTGSKSLER
jgi:hypothetical protein